MKRALIIILLSLSIIGCTEQIPFEAAVTGDTDWVPSITLAENNYNRFALWISRPSRKELLRNIAFYSVELQELPSPSFVRIDSLPHSYLLPAYLAPSFQGYYDSRTILKYNTEYKARLAVHYHDGMRRTSIEISFATPVERGKVLRRLNWPAGQPPFGYLGFETVMGFGNSSLYLLHYERLFRIDTTRGQVELLSNFFAPPSDDRNKWFRSIALCGDTLFTFYPIYSQQLRYTLVRYFLQSNRVDSTMTIQLPVGGPGYFLQALTGGQSRLYSLWGNFSGRSTVVELDPATGNVLKIYPSIPDIIPYPYVFLMINESLWSASNRRYDNRIIKYDPSTGTLLEQHRNPLFYSVGLAWDGANFWVIDAETQTLSKLQLEGL